MHDEEKSPAEILNSFRSVTKKSEIEFISFNRMQTSKLLQLMKIYKNPKVDLQKTPDINFIGEIAADAGGPTKEFFHIIIESLFKVDNLIGALFTGERGHYVPLCSVDAITSGCFLMVGKVLGHSILHGGPGIPGLAPAIAKYLMSGSVADAEGLVDVKDLPDLDMRAIIEKVHFLKIGLANGPLNFESLIKELLSLEILLVFPSSRSLTFLEQFFAASESRLSFFYSLRVSAFLFLQSLSLDFYSVSEHRGKVTFHSLYLLSVQSSGLAKIFKGKSLGSSFFQKIIKLRLEFPISPKSSGSKTTALSARQVSDLPLASPIYISSNACRISKEISNLNFNQ